MKKPKLRDLKDSDGYYSALQLLDAEVDFRVVISQRHTNGVRSKHNLKGSTALVTTCIVERATLDMPGVLWAKILKGVAHVVFKNNPHIARKFDIPKDGKVIIELNDQEGMKGLKQKLKFPIEIWLLVPRKNHSLEFTRSEEFKQKRKESRERNKGLEPRPYTTPTSKGFRNGSGARRNFAMTGKGVEA